MWGPGWPWDSRSNLIEKLTRDQWVPRLPHRPDCFMFPILCKYLYTSSRSRLCHRRNIFHVYWSRQSWVFRRLSPLLLRIYNASTFFLNIGPDIYIYIYIWWTFVPFQIFMYFRHQPEILWNDASYHRANRQSRGLCVAIFCLFHGKLKSDRFRSSMSYHATTLIRWGCQLSSRILGWCKTWSRLVLMLPC